jgi:hypothetical protein
LTRHPRQMPAFSLSSVFTSRAKYTRAFVIVNSAKGEIHPPRFKPKD